MIQCKAAEGLPQVGNNETNNLREQDWKNYLKVWVFVSSSNRTLTFSMHWTQIWIFPPQRRSYCSGSCYVPSSYFCHNLCYQIVHWLVLLCFKHMQQFLKIFIYLKQKNKLFMDIVHLNVVLIKLEFYTPTSHQEPMMDSNTGAW